MVPNRTLWFLMMTSAVCEFGKKMLAGKQQILFNVLLNAPLKIVYKIYQIDVPLQLTLLENYADNCVNHVHNESFPNTVGFQLSLALGKSLFQFFHSAN